MKVQGRDCALGVDISNWQNNRGPVDYAAIAGSGVEFMYAKASEGFHFTDPYYHTNRDGWKTTGKPFGGYHWLKPNQDWRAQADLFLAHTNNAEGCDFFVLDAEEAGITDEQVVGWARRVRDATRLPGVIYCGAFTDPAARSDGWLEFTPLLAAYGANLPGQRPELMSTPRPPEPWRRWDIWQFTSKATVPGLVGPVDLNVADVRWLQSLTTPTPAPSIRRDTNMVEYINGAGCRERFQIFPDGSLKNSWETAPGSGEFVPWATPVAGEFIGIASTGPVLAANGSSWFNVVSAPYGVQQILVQPKVGGEWSAHDANDLGRYLASQK